MLHGLLWFPLLIVFFALAGAGWNEYQKLTRCQAWAQEFERYKYDIEAVLVQDDQVLRWGKPHRQGPKNLQEFKLDDLTSVKLYHHSDRLLDLTEAEQLQTLSQYRSPHGLHLITRSQTAVQIPFTDLALALRWGQWLMENRQKP